MMRVPRSRLVAAGLLTAGALSAALPLAPALAFVSPPLVLQAATQGTGKLVVKGAAVDVPITYTCTANQGMQVYLTLTQASGKKVASGSNGVNLACNGSTGNTTIRVSPKSGGAAFGVGNAAVRLDVYGYTCSGWRCYSGSDTFTSTIKITK